LHPDGAANNGFLVALRRGSWVRRRESARRVAIACVSAVLLWSQPAWSLDRPSAGPDTGPYRVLTLEHIVLHDAARHRNIPVKIYYPDAAGPFPVIVFSHGALASKDAYSGLGQYWASFGYVSIHPSHADSVADSGFRGTLVQAIGDPRAWENRARDVSFVLDSLAHVASFAPQLARKLDLTQVGVAGHSFGAYTAALIGGTTVHLPEKQGPQSFADPRATAVVLLSPQGEGRLGLTADSWDHLRLPVLLVYGSRDFGPFGEPPAWRNEAFVRAPPGEKYDVELDGATHMQCARSLAAAADPPDPLFQCIKVETLAFWNAYLKQDPDARHRLASRDLPACSADAGRFAAK
jgi:predicted dienelactone hydrolase